MDFIDEENFIEEIYFVLFSQGDYNLYNQLLDFTLNG